MTEAVSDPNPNNEEVDGKGATVLIPADPVEKVEPVTPEAKAEPVKVDEATAPVVYEPTGDVGLDMALEFVGKQGLAVDHPAMKAAQEGDFSILKATLAAKGTPGWEQFVALGEAAYKRTQEAEAKSAAALTELVHTAAGGKEEWKAIQTWAAANATPAEKAEINALLNKGGLAAKGAVTYLTNAYNKAANVVREPKDALDPNAARGAPPSGDNSPLSAAEYSRAVQQLNVKLAGRLEESKEYAALQRRRAGYVG
jgi:hypothetical protein